MPELPDVELMKQRIDKNALNKTIKKVTTRSSRVFKTTAGEIEKIKNGKITAVSRTGKYLFLHINENTVIVMHFGMTGNMITGQTIKEDEKYIPLLLELGNGRQLAYYITRKLGRIDITENKTEYLNNNDIGPDAMEISEKEFAEYLAGSKKMIKPALMDQSSVSGIGNIYADEILFQAGLHPKAKANKLTGKSVKKLYDAMHDVLKKSIDSEADPEKMPGNFLIPHRDEGENCPKCKGQIKKYKVSGRGGYYCPQCQKK